MAQFFDYLYKYFFMENEKQSPNDQQVKPEVVASQQTGKNNEQAAASKEKEGIEQDGSIKNTK